MCKFVRIKTHVRVTVEVLSSGKILTETDTSWLVWSPGVWAVRARITPEYLLSFHIFGSEEARVKIRYIYLRNFIF